MGYWNLPSINRTRCSSSSSPSCTANTSISNKFSSSRTKFLPSRKVNSIMISKPSIPKNLQMDPRESLEAVEKCSKSLPWGFSVILKVEISFL